MPDRNLINQFIVDNHKSVQESLLAKIFEQKEAITIFDIGACEGSNSVRYAKMFPNASVYAIEPLPKNFELIKSNISQYQTRNVRGYQVCFSNKPGMAEFYVSSGNPAESNPDWDYGNKSSSLLPPDQSLEVFPWLKFKEKVEVPTETLDNFCKKLSIPIIHFIHMDVQGAELMVLEGAEAMLRNTYCIWLEVENVPLYKGQPLKNDVEQFFKKNKFSKLLDTVGKIAGDQFWVNDAFVPKSKSSAVFMVKLINKLPQRFSTRLINRYLSEN